MNIIFLLFSSSSLYVILSPYYLSLIVTVWICYQKFFMATSSDFTSYITYYVTVEPLNMSSSSIWGDLAFTKIRKEIIISIRILVILKHLTSILYTVKENITSYLKFLCLQLHISNSYTIK